MFLRDNQGTWSRSLMGVLAILLFGAASLPAQQLTGSISGTVKDTSGAVVPGADITLTREGSGEVRRTVSNSEGYFTVASLFAGTFNLTVQAQGFQKYEQTGIVVGVGDNRNLTNIDMQVGATTETVTVLAQIDTMVPTDTGEISNTITEKQLQNVAVVGRSAAELIKILPGMAATGAGVENKPGFSGEAIGINGNGDGGRQSALGHFSANGTRPESMDIVSDGAHVSDPGCNCATPVNPNVDMLQEFKVLRSNFGAEHAKGPVVMSAVSKQGGTDFHGTGYYYMRDYRLNANEFLLNKAGQERPKNRYRFPGFNIGGPLTKGRDKAFFFFGVERFLQTIDTGVLQSIVPTEAMINGDYSDTSYLAGLGDAKGSSIPNDPATGQPYPNGIIPQNQVDPTGKILSGLLTRPNVDPTGGGAGFNYVRALELDQNMWQFLGRVDYNFSDMTKLFVRYNKQNETQNFPVGLWWRNAAQVPYPTPVVGKNASDSLAVNFSHVLDPSSTNEFVFGYTFVDFPNSFEDPSKVSQEALGIPFRGIFDNQGENMQAFTSWGGTATMLNPGGFDPVLFATKHLISIGDNFSKVAGTHTLRFGGYYEHVINNQPGNDYSNGLMVTNNSGSLTTGNTLADLLTGRVTEFQQSTKNVLHNIAFTTFEWYAQDSWKVNSRLTLDYGVRFARLGPWYDREGFGLATFNPSQYDPNTGLSDFSGLTWHAIDDSLPTSGRAEGTKIFVSPRFGLALDVFGSGRTILRGGFGVFRYHDPQGPFPGAVDIPSGFRRFTISAANTLSSIENISPGATKYDVTAIDPTDDTQPVTYNWSFMITNRLPSQITWEIGYVGNASRNLEADGFRNINLVPVGAMFAEPNPGDADPNNFRPFKNFGSINTIKHTLYQDYHSLQTTLSRQVGRANITANYTFGKVMGIRGGQQGSAGNQFDIRQNYGPLAYDRTHIFNLAYVYELPTFAKNAGWNRLAQGIADGWQISGITQFSSGPNLQAAVNNGTNFNMNVQGLNNKELLGTDAIPLQPYVTCDPRENLGENQFINGSCFMAPSVVGQNGAYVFPDIRGPGFQNHDLSVFKNWDISEEKKLQFRFSMYNMFNHPNVSFTSGDNNTNLQFDENGNMTNERFGFADAKFGRRIIQLAIKFYF